jgi:hypothetical protein
MIFLQLYRLVKRAKMYRFSSLKMNFGRILGRFRSRMMKVA